MRASQAAVVCCGIFSICQVTLPQVAVAASYVASLAGPTVLRNNHGTLVQSTSTSSDTPQSVTTITVIKNGNATTTYISPQGTGYWPSAISDSEIIVGVSSDTTGKVHATVFSTGVVTDIHSAIAAAFGLDSSTSMSFANDVNDSGEIVGSIRSASASFGFKYKDGVVVTLSSVAGVSITDASNINNRGQITVTTADNRSGLYSQGALELFHYPAESGEAPPTILSTDMNDSGQVAGLLYFPHEQQHLPATLAAFRYQVGGVTNIGAAGPGIYASSSGRPSINNAGVIVGTIAHSHFNPSAFIYINGQMQDLTSMTDMSGLPYNSVTSALSISDDGVILALANGVPILLTPISQTDTAVYNFEAGTQGWESNGEPIIGVQTTTAQKFAGNSSLAMQFNNVGFSSVRVVNPSVQPGQTITFHFYLPANSSIEWVQPFALGDSADNWAWYGVWTPVSNLQLGAWNTLTVSVPSNAHALNSIGFEMFASQPAAGSATPAPVYLDSVDFGGARATAQYNFEAGTQNWQSNGDPPVSIATSATQKFAGNKSLALSMTGVGTARVVVSSPAVPAGSTITFHVYLPVGTSVDWIQPFAQEGADGMWAWHGNWQPTSALQTGAWNTIVVTVPATAHTIASLGLELATSGANAETVFVDEVSF